VIAVVAVYWNWNPFTDMATSDEQNWKEAKSIYDFTAKDIDGNEVSLSKYKDHVCVIVNVACLCGLVKQYRSLQTLYEKYGESKGLRILAFPANQFNGQEPWPEEKIKEFAQHEYNVTFDLFSKIKVNGNEAHPLWKYLKTKQGGTLGDFIKWNYTKFLIDKQGQPVKRYAPTTDPKDIVADMEKLF